MFSAEQVCNSDSQSSRCFFPICLTAFAGLGRKSVTPCLFHLFQSENRRKQLDPLAVTKRRAVLPQHFKTEQAVILGQAMGPPSPVFNLQ